MQATQKNGRVGKVAEGMRGTYGQEPLLFFSGKEWSRQGKQGWDWLI